MANMSLTTHPSRGRSSGTPVQVFGGSPSCLTRPFAARAPGGGGPGDLRKVAALPAEEDTTPLHSLGRSDPSRYNSRERGVFELPDQTGDRGTDRRTDGLPLITARLFSNRRDVDVGRRCCVAAAAVSVASGERTETNHREESETCYCSDRPLLVSLLSLLFDPQTQTSDCELSFSPSFSVRIFFQRFRLRLHSSSPSHSDISLKGGTNVFEALLSPSFLPSWHFLFTPAPPHRRGGRGCLQFISLYLPPPPLSFRFRPRN